MYNCILISRFAYSNSLVRLSQPRIDVARRDYRLRSWLLMLISIGTKHREILRICAMVWLDHFTFAFFNRNALLRIVSLQFNAVVWLYFSYSFFRCQDHNHLCILCVNTLSCRAFGLFASPKTIGCVCILISSPLLFPRKSAFHFVLSIFSAGARHKKELKAYAIN